METLQVERVDTKASVKLTRFLDRFDYIDRLFKELDSTVWQSMANSLHMS